MLYSGYVTFGGRPFGRRCPATESPPRSLPGPETLFRYRFFSRRIYFRTDSPPREIFLKNKVSGEKKCFIPRQKNLPPGGVFFSTRVRLKSHHIYSQLINF